MQKILHPLDVVPVCCYCTLNHGEYLFPTPSTFDRVQFNPLLRNGRSKAPLQTCRGLDDWARSLVLEANQTPTPACLHGRIVNRKICSERIMWNPTCNHLHCIQRHRTPRLIGRRVFGLMRQNEPSGSDTAQFVCWVKTKPCTSPQTHHLPPEARGGGQQQQEDLLPGKTRMPNIQQTHREGSQSAWVSGHLNTSSQSNRDQKRALHTWSPRNFRDLELFWKLRKKLRHL